MRPLLFVAGSLAINLIATKTEKNNRRHHMSILALPPTTKKAATSRQYDMAIDCNTTAILYI